MDSDRQTPSSPASEPASLRVVVCYATAGHEIARELRLAPGATIADAIAASRIFDDIAALAQAGTLDALADPRDPGAGAGATAFDPALHAVGLYSRKKPPETLLRDGDRVELYRPLLADPKEARRRRASAKPAASSAQGS